MENTTVKPGTPVYDNHYSKTGYIISEEKTSGMQLIGASGLKPITKKFQVVWLDQNEKPHHVDELFEGTIERYLELAQQHQIPPIDNVEEVAAQARAAQEKGRQEVQAAQDKAKNLSQEFEAKYLPMVPKWAKAVIVADLIEDQSDGMSDYYGSTSRETIILAFSKHTRDLFPEMRKAALNHEETKFLATVPADAENREKYSMGGGYFLKEGGRHANGWKVSKTTFYSDIIRLPFGQWAVPENSAPATPTENLTAGIEEHTHTKKNIQMFIVILSDRVEKDEFNSLRDSCKYRGGWYSRPWSTTPGGFAFVDMESAERFKKEHNL